MLTRCVASAVAICAGRPNLPGATRSRRRAPWLSQVESCELVRADRLSPGDRRIDRGGPRAGRQPAETTHGGHAARRARRNRDRAARRSRSTAARWCPRMSAPRSGLEPGGARPMVVVLVTYALPARSHARDHLEGPAQHADILAGSRERTRRARRRPAQDHWSRRRGLLLAEARPGSFSMRLTFIFAALDRAALGAACSRSSRTTRMRPRSIRMRRGPHHVARIAARSRVMSTR